MDDDLDDFELFWSTIVSHYRLIYKSAVNLTHMAVNGWPTLPPLPPVNQWTHRLATYAMRPQSMAFVALVIVVAVVCHTFEYWFKSLTRSSINLIKRLNLGLTFASTALTTILPAVECISHIGDNVVQELKDDCVGVYAIQGRRPKMEDKFSYINDSERLGIEYWAVFDGHGGDSAAIFAESNLYKGISRRVEEIISKNNVSDNCHKSCDYFCPSNDSKDVTPKCSKDNECATDAKPITAESKFESLSVTSLSQIVTEEVLEVDKQLIVDCKYKGDVSGSTALIALRIVAQNKLIVANVGDSRGVICDSEGNAIPLSFDHKPNQQKEHKRIKEAGGFIKFNGVWRVAGILATSRALGDYPLKDTNLVIAEPDILSFNLNDIKPKFMVLASDGLWDTFSNEEAVSLTKELLIKAKDRSGRHKAHEIAKSLVNESYKRGSVDNVTVILVIFDDGLQNESN